MITFLVVTDWIDDKSFTINAQHIIHMKQRDKKGEIFFGNGDSVYVKETITEIMEALAKKSEVEISIPQMTMFDEGVGVIFSKTEKATPKEVDDLVEAIDNLEPIVRDRNV